MKKAILGFILFVVLCGLAAFVGNYIGERYPIIGLVLGLIALTPMMVYYIQLFIESRRERKQRMEYKKWARVNSHFDSFDEN